LTLQEDIEIAANNARDATVPRLYKIIIPGEYKIAILKWLDGLGISRSTLFPEIDGIAATTKFRVIERNLEQFRNLKRYRDQQREAENGS
jgi:hypothetical protein